MLVADTTPGPDIEDELIRWRKDRLAGCKKPTSIEFRDELACTEQASCRNTNFNYRTERVVIAMSSNDRPKEASNREATSARERRGDGSQLTLNPDYIAAVKESLAASPFPALVGMQLVEVDLDLTHIALEVEDRHLQPFGIVHGGVLATLIDTATFWAAFWQLPSGSGLVNVDLKLNYLAAVPLDRGCLTAVGRCLRAGRQISYSEARVIDDEGRLIAHGTSTLMSLPGKGLDINHPKFNEGS